jgi:hypothetical protein
MLGCRRCGDVVLLAVAIVGLALIAGAVATL